MPDNIRKHCQGNDLGNWHTPRLLLIGENSCRWIK